MFFNGILFIPESESLPGCIIKICDVWSASVTMPQCSRQIFHSHTFCNFLNKNLFLLNLVYLKVAMLDINFRRVWKCGDTTLAYSSHEKLQITFLRVEFVFLPKTVPSCFRLLSNTFLYNLYVGVVGSFENFSNHRNSLLNHVFGIRQFILILHTLNNTENDSFYNYKLSSN